MSLHQVTPGENAPEEFNVIIEIPMNADPVKYEGDKDSGALFVDRFLTTSMHYPCSRCRWTRCSRSTAIGTSRKT